MIVARLPLKVDVPKKKASTVKGTSGPVIDALHSEEAVAAPPKDNETSPHLGLALGQKALQAGSAR
jgi:hypothetical protein